MYQSHETPSISQLSVVRGKFADEKLKILVDHEDFDILHPFEWGAYPTTAYTIGNTRYFRILVQGFHRECPKLVSMSALIRLKYSLMLPGLAKLYMIKHPTRKGGDLSRGPTIIDFRKKNFHPGGPTYFEPERTFQEIIDHAKEWYGRKVQIFDVKGWIERQKNK